MLATLSQYLLILIVGALLWIPLSADFRGSNAEQTELAEALENLQATLAFLFCMAFNFSWPVFFILLLTLGLLRGYGPSWPAWQRWLLLLAGITLSAFLPVPYVRAAWSELLDVSLGWALEVCRPWMLAAYLVTLWSNRKYLRSAFPSPS
ncbi:hypothetical protein [Hymenobacter cellulosilyticus]|uniref:Uncharacterized protein n=1 Tax=Hymenobacter cellulosilyticus TaxID=2932248 RepID=A0A8T9Q7Z3_9BACT|nr:hypothetical protein [Hymenobacter cellulosilyticus]UOQ72188.1 hypothetical protein MUN79_27100 [Hymenobacter cellulosilyticus]